MEFSSLFSQGQVWIPASAGMTIGPFPDKKGTNYFIILIEFIASLFYDRIH